MKTVFFGPTSISGIGQVTRKYAQCMGGDFVEFGKPLDTTKTWDVGFAFVIPLPDVIRIVSHYAKQCSRMMYYTICETEPVNEAYGKLLELSDTLWTSSSFCSRVLKKQFPHGNFPVLHLFAPSPAPQVSLRFQNAFPVKYVFYHIGNIIDQRKNIHKLIECFCRAAIPESLLVLKATCHTPVTVKFPGVHVINDFLNDEDLESLHAACDCYVSFSHSEGAGMGAVEAAIRNKPVIIQEYGGTVEYIKTPFVVPCSLVPVGSDDFLFKKDHMWGDPSVDVMVQYMRKVAEENVKTYDHTFTRELMQKIQPTFFGAFST